MDAKDAVIKPRGGNWYELPDGSKVQGKEKARQTLMGGQGSGDGSKQVLSLLSLLSGRQDLARRAGTQFKGDRDIYTVAGYVDQGQETFEHYWNLYERNEVAGRIVDLLPKTTWKKPPTVAPAGEDADEPGEFTGDFDKLAKRLRLWSRFERADRLSRIGRFGLIFIGTPGDDQTLSEEMGGLQGQEDVLYLTAFHEDSVTIEEWENDPTNERYDLPRIYGIRLSSNSTKGKGRRDEKASSADVKKVHWSRVIHIAEDILDSDVYGRPALKRVLNRLYDVDKITAATGEAYWQLASRILTGSVNPDMTMDKPQFDELGENLEELVHDLRRQFLAEGIELKWLESTPPSVDDVADLFLMLLAVGAGVPKRILFGTETGERASEQDERQWLGSVHERREQHAEPVFVRALVDRLIEYGGLPKPQGGEGTEPGEYEVTWPSLYEQTEEQTAKGNKDRAETARILTPVGSDPFELVVIDEDGEVRLKTSKQIDEELEEAEEEEEEPEEPETPDEDDQTGEPIVPEPEEEEEAE